MVRKARAFWRGTGKDGSGHLTAYSGVLSSTPYSFKTRFENEKGTNGQGADLLETRVWDTLSDRVASYSASRSFRTAAI